MPPFPRAEAVRMVEVALGRPIDELFLEFSEPIAAASIAQVHKARIRTAGGRGDGRREGGAARRARGLRPRSPGHARRRPPVRAHGARCAPPQAARDRGDARPLRLGRDGPAPRGGGRLGTRREHQGRSRFPGAEARMGPHRPRRAHHHLDRRHPPQRSRGHRGGGLRPGGARAHGDPVLPAPRHPRRLSSTPTCIPATCSSTRRAASWRSISASWAGSA